MKNGLFYIIVVLSTLCRTDFSHAWGALGHKVVCDVAWRLSAKPVQLLLSQTAQRMGYGTFAESCVWADRIKSLPQYDRLKPLHYMNVVKEATTAANAPCLTQAQPQCVVTAIPYYLAKVGNAQLSREQRDKALLLVGHFIADIHQPLHVAYVDDRGGSSRNVIFQGRRLSLHRLWDSRLLSCRQRAGKSLSWRALGYRLYEKSTAQPVSLASNPEHYQRISDIPVLLWANESLQLTRKIYTGLTHNTLPDSYCDHYYPLALDRLQVAGTRLARVLNSVINRSVNASPARGEVAPPSKDNT